MIEKGVLGSEDQGAGFFTQRRARTSWCWISPRRRTTSPAWASVAALDVDRHPQDQEPRRRNSPSHACLVQHPQAQFLWSIYRDVFHYIAYAPGRRGRVRARYRLRHPLGFRLEAGPVRNLAGRRLGAGGTSGSVKTSPPARPCPTRRCRTWVTDGRKGVHSAGRQRTPPVKTGKMVPRSSKLPVYQAATSSPNCCWAKRLSLRATTVFENRRSVRMWTAKGFDGMSPSFRLQDQDARHQRPMCWRACRPGHRQARKRDYKRARASGRTAMAPMLVRRRFEKRRNGRCCRAGRHGPGFEAMVAKFQANQRSALKYSA